MQLIRTYFSYFKYNLKHTSYGLSLCMQLKLINTLSSGSSNIYFSASTNLIFFLCQRMYYSWVTETTKYCRQLLFFSYK